MNISAINSMTSLAMKSEYGNTSKAIPASYVDMSTTEEKSSNKFGLLTIGAVVLGLAGIGYGIYAHKSLKGVEDALKKKSEALVNSEKKLTTAEKALQTANEQLKAIQDAAKDAAKKTVETVKEVGEKLSEKAKEGAETIAEGTKKVKKSFKQKFVELWNKIKSKFSGWGKKDSTK